MSDGLVVEIDFVAEGHTTIELDALLDDRARQALKDALRNALHDTLSGHGVNEAELTFVAFTAEWEYADDAEPAAEVAE